MRSKPARIRTRTCEVGARRAAVDTTGLCVVREPPAGIEPAPRPYKGRVLPLTLRRLGRMETTGVEPARCRCKRAALPPELHPRVRWCGRMDGVEPSRARGTSFTARGALRSAQRLRGALRSAQRPRGSSKGDRPDSNRYREDHDLGCCRYTTATTNVRTGTAGLEPAASRLTSERSPPELRPHGHAGAAQTAPGTGLQYGRPLPKRCVIPAQEGRSPGTVGSNFRIRALRGSKHKRRGMGDTVLDRAFPGVVARVGFEPTVSSS